MPADRDFDTERLCRLNGKQPTAREKWRAMYRLYRLSHRGDAYGDMAADDCFRVLWRDWRPFQLLDGSGRDGMVDNRHVPPFLRRQLLTLRRRLRLHGSHPEWADRDKVVAHRCREQHGMEVTPDEVAAVRRKVINMARAKASEIGLPVPSDDDELLRFIWHPGASDAG